MKIHGKYLLSVGVLLLIANAVFVWPKHSSALLLDCSTASSINVSTAECNALIDLYNQTNGPSWMDSVNWDTDTDICTWEGVTCTNIGGFDHVTSLSLSGNNLNGVLPTSLTGLSYLTFLELNENSLTGTLPASWATMTGLQKINLGINSLNGDLPASWATMTNLETLNVRQNQLTGTLPGAWSGMRNMKIFDVSFNHINGTLPISYAAWTGLESFAVYLNRIEGNLPTQYAAWGNTFKAFSADSNLLTGEIPASWIALTGLESFSIESNQLTGMLPASWSAFTHMTNFNVFNNQFQGTLPTNWASWTGIRNFNVQTNSLTGTLPAEYSGWRLIQEFNAAANQLVGTLPDEYAAWDNISSFQVQMNNLTGVLPSAWSTWGDTILYFYAGFNTFVGTLPTAWSTWTSIINFMGQNTNIEGDLPSGWSTWTSIQSFRMNNALLTGTLPASWSSWAGIEYFGVEENGIVGTLPDSWGNWGVMNYLMLGSNNLTGSLPASWSGMLDPYSLDVSNNGLVGTLPASWGSIKPAFLNLSYNYFTGEVPASWTGMSTLNLLSIGNNCLTTTLPEPPASFVDAKAGGTAWKLTQNLCGFPYSDLTIRKSYTGGDFTHLTDILMYTISFENSGSNAIDNVMITDTLPPYLTYVTGSFSTGLTISGQTLTWAIGTMSANSTGRIQLFAEVNTGVGGYSITNTATISGDATDLTGSNNTSTSSGSTTQNYGTGTDLIITKTSSGNVVHVGDIVPFQISIQNAGYIDRHVVVTDTLPAGLTYITGNFITGLSIVGQTLTWDIPSLFASFDSPTTFYILAEVTAGNSGDTLINSAAITGTIPDTDWSNNSSTADTLTIIEYAATGDLSVTKWSPMSTVIAGHSATFRLTYENHGISAETGFSLRDFMDSGFIYLTTNYTSGLTITTLPTGGTWLSWDFTGSLPVNTSGSIIVQAFVMTGVASGFSLTNSVSITGIKGDVSSSDNQDSVSLYIYGDPSLGATGSSSSTGDEGGSSGGGGGGGGGNGGGFPTGIIYQNTGTTIPYTTGILTVPVIQDPTDTPILGSAPVMSTNTCLYHDGDFEKYKMTFSDITNTIFESAVYRMLDYCLVQGYSNKGELFGVYKYLRWGEAYKIFTRLAGLSFSEISHPAYWSDMYEVAGNSIQLWRSTSSTAHPVYGYITLADVYTISNNLLKHRGKAPIPYDPTLKYGDPITRGKLALFIEQVMVKIKD